MNLRPLGYEPNELPDCSTPRQGLGRGSYHASRILINLCCGTKISLCRGVLGLQPIVRGGDCVDLGSMLVKVHLAPVRSER